MYRNRNVKLLSRSNEYGLRAVKSLDNNFLFAQRQKKAVTLAVGVDALRQIYLLVQAATQ
jgi:hypothetical protein